MIEGVVSYHDKLLVGFIVDHAKKYSFMVSDILLKYFDIGYIFEVDNSIINRSLVSNNIKLALALRCF
jgi:hypothetical protein